MTCKIFLTTLAFLGCASGHMSKYQQHTEKFLNGKCLSKSEDAIKLGEQRLTDEFGAVAKKYHPYSAILQNDSIWIIRAKTSSNKGGGPYIEISAISCKTVFIEFGK